MDFITTRINFFNRVYNSLNLFRRPIREKSLIAFEVFSGNIPDGDIRNKRPDSSNMGFDVNEVFSEQTIDWGLTGIHGDIFTITVNEKTENLYFLFRKIFNVGFNPTLFDPLFIKISDNGSHSGMHLYDEKDNHVGCRDYGCKAKILLVVTPYFREIHNSCMGIYLGEY